MNILVTVVSHFQVSQSDASLEGDCSHFFFLPLKHIHIDIYIVALVVPAQDFIK